MAEFYLYLLKSKKTGEISVEEKNGSMKSIKCNKKTEEIQIIGEFKSQAEISEFREQWQNRELTNKWGLPWYIYEGRPVPLLW